MHSGAPQQPFLRPHLDFSAAALEALPAFADFDHWVDDQLALLERRWPQRAGQAAHTWRGESRNRPSRRPR